MCSSLTKLQKNFNKIDLTAVAASIKEFCPNFSISQVGYSYIFTFGEMVARDNQGKIIPAGVGIHNFFEIMVDGSIRARIVLIGKKDSNEVDITAISYYINVVFKNIFELLLGKNFARIFISAHGYEKLTVLKQFTPVHSLGEADTPEDKIRYRKHLIDHKHKYGNNLIVVGNRVPINNYSIIDRRLFSDFKVRFNNKSLLNELFYSSYSDLGYIDPVDKPND